MVTASLAVSANDASRPRGIEDRYRRSLLGNMIILVLDAGGIRLKTGAAGRPRSSAARLRQLIDIYRNTRNGAFFFRRKESGVEERQGRLRRGESDQLEKNKIVWNRRPPTIRGPSPCRDVAAANQLKSLADLGKWVSTRPVQARAASSSSAPMPCRRFRRRMDSSSAKTRS